LSWTFIKEVLLSTQLLILTNKKPYIIDIKSYFIPSVEENRQVNKYVEYRFTPPEKDIKLKMEHSMSIYSMCICTYKLPSGCVVFRWKLWEYPWLSLEKLWCHKSTMYNTLYKNKFDDYKTNDGSRKQGVCYKAVYSKVIKLIVLY
jgi:hypothetical protein